MAPAADPRMNAATRIVPPRPRTVERRVMRRPKTRACGGVATAALVAALVSLTLWHEAAVVLLGVAVAGGVVTVILRLVEKPREVVVRKVEHASDPAVIH